MGRLDDGATLRAQERLDAAPALRTLVEEAGWLREEWRRDGPGRLVTLICLRFSESH